MKRKIILLTISAFLLTVISCSNPSVPLEEVYTVPLEEVYTVWTGSAPYSVVQAEGLTLDDGYYWHCEVTKSQWNELYSSFLVENDEDRHYWTKAQIKDYLIGREFGNSEATKESAWLTTINHGFIINRERNIVHIILK